MKVYKKIFILTMFIFLCLCIWGGKIVNATSSTQVLEDGVYTIKTKINEKFVLDITGASKDDTANVQIWENVGENQQKFKITYNADGYYTIENMNSKKLLDVANGGKTAGTNVWQIKSNGTEAQKWVIQKNADNTYSIISKLNKLYLDVYDGKAKNGQNIHMFTGNNTDAQKFVFEKEENNSNNQEKIEKEIISEKTIDDGTYVVKTKINEKFVLDITGASKDDTANVQIWENVGENQQKFKITYNADGYYTIENINSKKLLDVANGGKTAGTNVWQIKSNGTDAQKWIIQKNADNTYSIISKLNKLYLDVYDGKAKNGQNIHMYTGNNTNAQKFVFEKEENNSNNQDKIEKEIISEKTIKDGIYHIKSKVNENFVLDISGASRENTANVQIWQGVNENQQKFKITYTTDGYYTIENVNSRKLLDVACAGMTAGTNVWQYQSNGTDAQKWIIKKNEDNTYSIISKLNNLYIDVYDGKAKNGQNIHIYTGNNTKAQKFVFEETTIVSNINIDDSKYPGYKEKLEKLKEQHPTWNFELLYTGLNFEDVTAGECKVHSRNLVPSSYSGEWVCPVCGTKLYDSGLYCASEKTVAHYMDPRNFLDDNNIFQFEKLNMYEASIHSLEGIKLKTNGTFLNDYSEDINNACRNKNVNPYYIVARLIQEQGRKGTKIGTGMDGGDGKTYYNPFNIGASGNGYDQIYNNALAKAKSYGWDTMQKALEGGIDFCKKNWLENYQNTLYQNKFDIDTRNGTSLYTHQYMQNIFGAYSEAKTLRSMYSQTNCLDGYFTFIIPVYENMSADLYPMPTNSTEANSLNVIVRANGGLKLRSGASTSSEVIEVIPNGTMVLSVQRGIGDNWNKVITQDGKIGYMSGNYLEIIDTIKNCNYTARVKTNDGSGCKVRIGPSINLDRLTTLSESTEVTIIEKGTFNNIDGYDWCRVITPDGRQGYMPLRYLN